MVTTKLNLSMTEPQVRQIYAKQGDTGRVLDISLDQTPEDGTLRILRPDGVEVTSEAVTGGEVESGGTFESLTEADVTELTVGIEPVQDLNGYDKPWVGGAGANKWDEEWEGGTINTSTGANSDVGLNTNIRSTNFISALPNTEYYFCRQNFNGNIFEYDNGKNFIRVVPSPTTFTTAANTRFLRFYMGTAYGNTYNHDIALNYPSSITTYSPYSNICPITGHDEVRVTRTGKNLLNLNVTSKTQNGITFTVNADGSIKVNGTATSGNAYFTKTTGAPPKMTKGTTVTLSGVEGSTTNQLYLQLIYIGADGSTISITSVSGATTYTFAQDATFSAYWLTVRQGATHDNTMVYPQLELGSTATSYEPYQGSTYTTSLGQTVYGGTLDMVTGVLTVTHAIHTVSSDDTSTANLGSGTNANRIAIVLSDAKQVSSSERTQVICNIGNPSTSVAGSASNFVVGDCCLYYPFSSNVVFFYGVPTTCTTRVEAINWLVANGAYFVYPLATPQTYQLTPQQIKTLVGTNNVWASSGDIVNITFTYGGLLSALPSDATSIVGKCYCDVEQSGVSSMPFTLNVKKNERQ